MSNQLVVNNASLLAIKNIVKHISDVELSDNEINVIVNQVFKPELTVNADEHFIVTCQLSDNNNRIKIVKASSEEIAFELFHDYVTAFEDGSINSLDDIIPLSLELAGIIK